MRKKIEYLIIILLLLVAGILIANRIIPKTFSQLVPEANSDSVACVMICSDGNTILFEDESYQELLNELESYQYFSERRNDVISANDAYDILYSGNICTIYFQDMENTQTLQTVVISDESILYIGEMQYSITPVLGSYFSSFLPAS